VKTILVADDLTGASDAGVQFTKAGLRTTVWLDPVGALDDAAAAVVVVDMNSRMAAPDAAYARMREFIRLLHPAATRSIIKKMDSTLCGNVGPEVRVFRSTVRTSVMTSSHRSARLGSRHTSTSRPSR
jgi:uncharacterized protein YgbK (DUF1537 family)